MSQWQDKIVVVSGGSKGLGLQIAIAFAKRGAKIALTARSQPALDNASEEVSRAGAKVLAISTDATDDQSVSNAVNQVNSELGRVDVLVNAVGKSTRRPVQEMTATEAQEMLTINYLTAVRCTTALLPDLLESHGHVINIGSLAGKTAWPYMAPYSAAKHALSVYSHQLRIELGDRLNSMLVSCGPIKRNDAGTRYDSQTNELPSQAAQPGAGAKLKGICPVVLAEKIIKAAERKRAELVVPYKTNLLFIANAISNWMGDWIGSANRKK